MTKHLASCTRFVRDEGGTSMAEYGLLLGLIGFVCMVATALLGANVSTLFNSLAASV